MSGLTPRINLVENKSVINLLINGAFEFDQRNAGNSSVVNNNYVVDRFYKTLGTSSQRVVVNQPTHKYAYQLVAAAGHAFEQRIEAKNLEGLLGQTLKFQVKIKLVSGVTFTPKIAILHANAEDNWTTSTQDLISDLDGTLDGNFTLFKYSFTVTQDMINNGLAVKLGDLVSLTAHTVQYAQALLYEDNGQTIDVDFTRAGKNSIEELQFCQRYFEKSYNIEAAVGSFPNYIGSANSRYIIPSNGDFLTLPLKVTKRVTPTGVMYNPETGGAGTHRNTSISTNPAGSVSSSYTGQNCVTLGVATGTFQHGWSAHWTVDAEL